MRIELDFVAGLIGGIVIGLVIMILLVLVICLVLVGYLRDERDDDDEKERLHYDEIDQMLREYQARCEQSSPVISESQKFTYGYPEEHIDHVSREPEVLNPETIVNTVSDEENILDDIEMEPFCHS